MADSKVSQLTAATTPLAGTELVYLVQGGNSRRATAQAIADLAADTDLTYDPATRLLSSSTGADVTLPVATASLPGLMAAADKALTDALIAAGVTAAGAVVTIPHIHGDLAGSVYIHVKNTSGGQLVKGTPVRVTGAVGDTTTLEVAAADATTAGTMPAIGILSDTLANNGTGHAVVGGELTGLATGSYSIGQALYVASGGGLTGTRPTSGTVQQVAIVGRVHASTGSVTVTIGAQLSPSSGDVTLAASVADVLSLSGQELQADDPGADRLLFWDDSAGKLTHLTLGTNLSITGTTLNAAGGSTDLGYTASTRLLTSSTGADVTLPLATTSDPGLMAAADKAKLDGVAAGAADYQEFTSSGTWTKPAGATFIYVECVSGGGGGGSGRRGAAGTVRCGGGGGASGKFVSRWMPASLAGATETITVGAGGTGAAARTTDDTSGSTGDDGGSSSFGGLLITPATSGGNGGTATGGFGGTVSYYGATTSGQYAGTGGGASATGSTGSNGTRASLGPGAGAGGGGITSANTASIGGVGGQGFGEQKNSLVASTSTGGGGSSGGGSGSGSGDGGGGGNASITAAAGSGGNGAFPGGGGGGGGASVNGFNSGAGGNGGAGVVRVWSW